MFQSRIVSPNRMRLRELLHRLVPIAFYVLLLASPLCRSAWADDLTIGAGEIRLDGTILSVDVEQKTFILTATSFTLPSGKTAQLAAAKSKSVAVNEQAILQTQDQTPKRIGLADLKAGMTASVIGRDAGTGRALPARIVAVVFPATAPASAVASAPALVAVPSQVAPTLQIQSGKIESLAYSPDSTMLAATASDGTLKLWNSKTGELLHSFEGHHAVGTPAISPDGTLLVSDSYVPDERRPAIGKNEVLILNCQTGNLLHSIPMENVAQSSVSLLFSPDGRRLASISEVGNTVKHGTSFRIHNFTVVKLWDIQTWQLLHTLNTEIDENTDTHDGAVAFSPDGKMLATGGTWSKLEVVDQKPKFLGGDDLRLWDAQTGEPLQKFVDKHTGMQWLSFTPDGKTLRTASGAGIVNSWDTQVGTLQSSLSLVKDQPAASFAFSSDGRTIAGSSFTMANSVVTSHSDITLWDAQTGQIVRTLIGQLTPAWLLAFSPDGKMVAGSIPDSQTNLVPADKRENIIHLWQVSQ